jgi:hypothetical protein
MIKTIKIVYNMGISFLGIDTQEAGCLLCVTYKH